MKKNGFTLIELLVVLSILGMVLTAIFEAYISTLKSYKTQSQVAMSNIEKLISFELIRKDIENAGFGVPENYSPINYDGTTLVLRSTLLLRNDATKCFGYIDSSGISLFSVESSEISDPDCNDNTFCYIALDLNYNLVQNSCYDISSLPSDIYLLFGLLDNKSSGFSNPYNEIQYYLSNSNLLSRCSPNTFELERTELQADGDSSTQPIFDCVRDFKVAFGIDTNEDGIADFWANTLPTTPTQIRRQVKEVIVVILYHEGSRDRDFTFSQGTISLNATSSFSLGSFTPSGDDVHYRWKLARITVNPMNLRRPNR